MKLLLVLLVVLMGDIDAGWTATCPKMEVDHVVPTTQDKARTVHSEAGPIYVAEKPLLTLDDFTAANVSVTEGQIVLNVDLTKQSARRIQAFTKGHVGERMVYIVDGRVIRTPKILDPITGSGFLIGPFSQHEGMKIADAINHKGIGCAALRP
jgi:preprotein translocase subunit SecD